ncbi:conserved hypothetical protein [Ricinus communis]|uniref:Uncharacterized protein n=1 Tax=Ricinus communis TaxID=3988 RepID=B9T460_RICCO|nr:conserved hypothetical protein [Ricinus communis]
MEVIGLADSMEPSKVVVTVDFNFEGGDEGKTVVETRWVTQGFLMNNDLIANPHIPVTSKLKPTHRKKTPSRAFIQPNRARKDPCLATVIMNMHVHRLAFFKSED